MRLPPTWIRFASYPMKRPVLTISILLTAVLLSSCAVQRSQPSAQAKAPARPDGVYSTDDWLGQWDGPEATFLRLDGGGNDYLVTIRNLDRTRTFLGSRQAGTIQFQRDGKLETIRHTDGKGTGMKWLADKSNCLTVKEGEGYCRGSSLAAEPAAKQDDEAGAQAAPANEAPTDGPPAQAKPEEAGPAEATPEKADALEHKASEDSAADAPAAAPDAADGKATDGKATESETTDDKAADSPAPADKNAPQSAEPEGEAADSEATAEAPADGASSDKDTPDEVVPEADAPESDAPYKTRPFDEQPDDAPAGTTSFPEPQA